MNIEMKKRKRKVNPVFAVIDTNVLVSALLSVNNYSNTVKILNSINNGIVIPLFNEDILKEYTDVLNRPKFSFPERLILKLKNIILKTGLKVEKKEICLENFPDPKDLVFYEVKMSKEDSYLVTGNMKHFPQEPKIVTPAEMVQILKEKGLLDEF